MTFHCNLHWAVQKNKQKKTLYKLCVYSRSARVWRQESTPGECFLKWLGVGVWEVNFRSFFEQKEGGMQGHKRRATRGRALSCNCQLETDVHQSDRQQSRLRWWQDDTHMHINAHTHTTPSSTLLISHSRAMLPAGQRNLSLDDHLSRHIWPISSELSHSPPHQHLLDSPSDCLIFKNSSKWSRVECFLFGMWENNSGYRIFAAKRRFSGGE